MKNQNLVIGCIVSAAVAGGVGFYGGTLYQQNQRTVAKAGQFANGAIRGGAAGQARTGANGSTIPGMRGGAVIGEITAKDDKSLTIKLADGSSKIVILSGTTTYRKTSDASLSDIAVGTKVSTFGSTNSDGSVTAQNIQIDPVMPNASPMSK